MKTALAVVMFVTGCAAAPPPSATASGDTASVADVSLADTASDAKTGTSLPDAVGKAEVSLAGAPTEGDDRYAMDLVQVARKGSLASAGASFPKHSAALWPGYHLHDLPVVLVPTTMSGKPLRAYLLGYPKLPAGAMAVADHPEAARHDGAIKELDSDEAANIAGYDAMTIRYVHADLDQPDRFIAMVAGQAMSRLMHYEAAWEPPGACGANAYPRGIETLALWFLECAVLAEALTATAAPVLETRMREVWAIRTAYGGINDMLRRMNDHYDNAFAPVALVGLRVLRNAGRLDDKGYAAQLTDWVNAPLAEPVDGFDARFLNDGTVRAAMLELAFRLNWNLAPVYAMAGTAQSMVPANTGGVPSPDLVETAKTRHQWAKMLARAKALTPVDGR